MKPLHTSPTLRDTLLNIYQIAEQTGQSSDFLSVATLTQAIFTSPASLNRTLLRLKELGLVEHQPYRGVRLTPAGRQALVPWLWRDRVARSFLNKVMGFEWHEVHQEARAMLSGMSDTVARRMFELAGSPRTCPQGEPIPDPDGKLAEPEDFPLHTAPQKTPLLITRILTFEAERLKYIGALRLIPGAELQLIHAAPFNGPLQLKLGHEYRIIGHNLAENIRVMVGTDHA